ncbi:MAG TPA: hypothetical protein VF018_15635, partial [Acidobacteriaceae bacterium]
FLLPVLLLGLSQPPDQPIDVSRERGQAQANLSADSIPARKFAFTGAEKAKIGSTFDGIEIHDPPDAQRAGCFTMRSYYFERHDARAPEYVGMTTCKPSRKFTTRKVDRPARLVPAY